MSNAESGYNIFYKSKGKVVYFMSALQEQAVQMIRNMSDDNVRFLIEVIQRLVLPKEHLKFPQATEADEGMKAFQKLDAAREEIKQYFPADFDPDKELEEARLERYESIS